MLQTEFVRNLNCNYERILLDKNPEENRYQYCIVTRGGIKGLLPCNLRYINGQVYLYYDISFTQSVAQLFSTKTICRQWVKDFLWGMRQIRQQMGRFLLDDANLLWHPHQIFQDLEKNDFYFIYVPYCAEDQGFGELMDFLVERIDYEDNGLVECVYRMHEKYSAMGEAYLKEQIYEDAKKLDVSEEKQIRETAAPVVAKDTPGEEVKPAQLTEPTVEAEVRESKKGIFYFLDGRNKKQKDERMNVYPQTKKAMGRYAVCEDTVYADTSGRGGGTEELRTEEPMGRTVYMEEVRDCKEETEGLYSQTGQLLLLLDRQTVILGKKKEEADCVIEDISVSRMHARITRDKSELYLEDLNSTNGTFKNGLRLQPYEKRRLEKEDEIRLGKITLFFR